MPDDNARKRLKKKMLDRWENEGGRIANESTISSESEPASNPNRTPASRDKSKASAPETSTKKRKLTQK